MPERSPSLFKKKNKRYIFRRNKRTILKSDLTDRQIIEILLKKFSITKKKANRKLVPAKSPQSNKATIIGIQGNPKTLDALIQGRAKALADNVQRQLLALRESNKENVDAVRARLEDTKEEVRKLQAIAPSVEQQMNDVMSEIEHIKSDVAEEFENVKNKAIPMVIRDVTDTEALNEMKRKKAFQEALKDYSKAYDPGSVFGRISSETKDNRSAFATIKTQKPIKPNTTVINSLQRLKKEELLTVDNYKDLLKLEPVKLRDEINNIISSSSKAGVSPTTTTTTTTTTIKKGFGADSTGPGLTNKEIEDHMHKYQKNGFIGVFARDQLNEIPPLIDDNVETLSFIINTMPISEPNGHWVAIYIDKRNDISVEYYDSFGDPPDSNFTKDIRPIIKKLKPKYFLIFKYNRIQEQNTNTSNCGYFAMQFLIDRYNGKPFKEATKYNDSKKGEANIEKFKAKFPVLAYINDE